MTAQETLMQRYGDPFSPNFQGQFMTLWKIQDDFPWFPNRNLFIHKDFKVALTRAFKALQDKGLHTEIHSCEGAFNQRRVRGATSTLSLHTWGCAIDLNAHNNQMNTQGSWSKAFIQTMKDNGIFCGVFFTRRTDPMHFALLNG